ncbi:hypothetical protein BKH43_04045 [Helicobacter sp. 13S00401-1]|uniref:hypothetical protein n=1 Tax=Helicobacter sp. 13S00401-1 TaxID=1905758 RepID=UPI000BA6DC92|nr:hypothetical protein [Helicobacter sp. 13S00401-1]PAF50738.1 hypothetical protein BKH43_04045 [Helicobacter sp. 13S00401-1]
MTPKERQSARFLVASLRFFIGLFFGLAIFSAVVILFLFRPFLLAVLYALAAFCLCMFFNLLLRVMLYFVNLSEHGLSQDSVNKHIEE